jgi:hypothetical protein
MFTKWHLCHEISIFCTRYLILEARKARRYLCAKRGRTRGATSERDSSGTTEGHERSEMPEGDGADSPTRAPKGRSGSPKNLFYYPPTKSWLATCEISPAFLALLNIKRMASLPVLPKSMLYLLTYNLMCCIMTSSLMVWACWRT